MSYAGDHAIIHLITFIMTQTGKKPRWIWNCFYGIFLTVYIGFYIYTSCIIFGGLFTYQTEQIYESYQSDCLYTDQLERIEHLVTSSSKNAELRTERKKNKPISFTVLDTLNNHVVFTGFFV